ncbi:MAG: LysR family transcriptional regulator [Sulfobacillus sp.]
MELKDLQAFLAVAECKSFSRAADRLALGQPAVSQRIRRLEDEAGQPLFWRDAHGVRLSEAGHRLLPHARQAVAALAAGQASLAAPAPDLPRLTLAAAPTIAGYRLGPMLAGLLAEFPEAPITVRVMRSQAVAQELAAGRVDLGVLRGPLDQFGLESVFLCRETMVLVRAPGTVPSSAFVAYDSESPFWHDLAEVLARLGMPPDSRLRADSLEAVKALAVAGAGSALLPWPVVAAELASGSLLRLPLPVELPGRSVVLAYRRNAVRTPLLRAAIDLAVKTVADPA